MGGCCIPGCKTTDSNKLSHMSIHRFPQDNEAKKQWTAKIKNKDFKVTSTSRICSLHFEDKCFSSLKTLKSNAVPTIFPVIRNLDKASASGKKMNKMINSMMLMSETELLADVKTVFNDLERPSDIEEYLSNENKCVNSAPESVKLWCLVQKQQYLITKLVEGESKQKKMTNYYEQKLEDSEYSKKDLVRKVETYKYIVKCLQEKQATLEEQIEILSSVESR